MLAVDSLSVAYGRVAAVQGISFRVPTNTILAVVGANGAGKSSTLNGLTGLVRRTGAVTFDGVPIDQLETDEIVRLGIVQVPQGRQLFPTMSVHDNLEIGGYLRTPADKKAAIQQLKSRFPILAERSEQLAGTLSGGQQQILAIARGLMAAPRVLLLDEPCLGLSPIMVREIAKVIRELHREGLTILLAEQNATFALSLASEVLVLEAGRITLSGTPELLKSSDEMRRSYLGV